jgi:hypothetical protein
MITLTEQQRTLIIKQIVDSINEYQTASTYVFDKEELNIVWVDSQESYILLKGDFTYSWAQPRDIESVVENFSDATLVEFYCDENCCDQEDFEEYITDELETA